MLTEIGARTMNSKRTHAGLIMNDEPGNYEKGRELLQT
jgi:hypothetical protein